MFIRLELDQQMFYFKTSSVNFPSNFYCHLLVIFNKWCTTKSTRCLPSSALHEKGKRKTFSLKIHQ